MCIRDRDNIKTIRFGQQGVSGSPQKAGESESYKNRRESFKARHSSNIAKGKMSAAYWADKELWAGGGGSVKQPPKGQKQKFGK